MDSDIFKEWNRELDGIFEQQNRKTVLIVDNCLAHPAIGGLTTIQLCFLSTNATSVTKSLEYRVKSSLKAKYCSRLIHIIIKAIDYLKIFIE